MKTRNEITCICGEIPGLLRHGAGFVRYSGGDGFDVGVYTSLHPYNLSSMLRVVYQADFALKNDENAAGIAQELVDAANTDYHIGTFSLKQSDGHCTLCLLQLLWVDRRPSRESLEELLSAGEAAMRSLCTKIKNIL